MTDTRREFSGRENEQARVCKMVTNKVQEEENGKEGDKGRDRERGRRGMWAGFEKNVSFPAAATAAPCLPAVIR